MPRASVAVDDDLNAGLLSTSSVRSTVGDLPSPGPRQDVSGVEMQRMTAPITPSRFRQTSFLASVNSTPRPRSAEGREAVSLRCRLDVKVDEATLGVVSASDAPHTFTLQGRSAADVREAVCDEVRVNLPEHGKYRVVSLMYDDLWGEDQLDMADLEDDDVERLAKYLQDDGFDRLRIEARIGLESRLLLSGDMVEHDEDRELFEHNVGEDNYKLTVHVARGKDLRGMSRNGTSDPFVQCELCTEKEGPGGEVAYELVDFLPPRDKKRSTRRTKKESQARFLKQTRVIKRNNVNPQWDEDLSFDIPMAACSRDKLESCVLCIKCFSADSMLTSQFKRTTNEHLIGSTTINMFDVLETIDNADAHEDDDGNELGSSDWYCIMDKKITPTRKEKLSSSANQAIRSMGSKIDKALSGGKRHVEPTPDQVMEDPAEAGEEEEKTGDLQLSFSLVKPEGNEHVNSPTELEPEPEPEYGTEPEPQLEQEVGGSPCCAGKIEVEVVQCTQILAPHKKHAPNLCVKMTLYDSGQRLHRQEKRTDNVPFEKGNLDPIFGAMHKQEMNIYEVEDRHELVLQLLHTKQNQTGHTEALGQTKVDLGETFGQLATNFGSSDAKISIPLQLDGQCASNDVRNVRGNSEKIATGECGTMQVKLTFEPNNVGTSAQDDPRPVQLSRTPSSSPKIDMNIQKIFQPSAESMSQPQQAASPVPNSGIQLKNCEVEVLMLGARELVRKPRKPEVVCEYLSTGAQAPAQSFHIIDCGQNPTFTAVRSDLERRSPSKLCKMIQDSQGTVPPKDTAKDTLVQAMLEMPHLTIRNVPFPFDASVRSKQTKLKITMYERPFRGPRKEFGSTTIRLCCTDGAGTGAPADEDTEQLWQDACKCYIDGVAKLCESTREPHEVSLGQVNRWWNQRLEFNQKEAEETLQRAILLWWTVHSQDGKVKNKPLIENTWQVDAVRAADQQAANLPLTGDPRSSQLRIETAQIALLKQVFRVVPDKASVDHILNAHMDLKLKSSRDRRIYKHDAQKWWERSSTRSTFIFESAWTEHMPGADFITDEDFRQFIIKLVEPSVEDLRTAVAWISNTSTESNMSTEVPTMNVRVWWEQTLDSITSESSRPKGKSELRSLLLDENRLSSHFEQQADAAGPSETEYIVDAEERANHKAIAGLKWVGAGGSDAEDAPDDVRIEIADESARPSRFDPFLAQWRQMYDKYGLEIPHIAQEWEAAWTTMNGDTRMTSSTLESRPDLNEIQKVFKRENFVKVLQEVLRLDTNIAEMLFKDLDADSSGTVHKDEAQEWFDTNARQGGQLRFERAWIQADRHCSNELSFTEFKDFIQVLLCPTDSDVDHILDEIGHSDRLANADDHTLRRRHNESKRDFENRCIESRNLKRRKRKDARRRRDAKSNDALELFKAAKDKLDCINDSFQNSDRQQCLLDLLANLDAAITRAENRQENFNRVVLAGWEKGRRNLPTTWEESCKGGMVPYFPRYLLNTEQEVIQVEGDTTITEGDTTDYETEGESAVPRVNVGAIRCAFRVSLSDSTAATDSSPLQVAETCRWREMKALMSPHRVVVRVYVIGGVGLRAMHSNSSSTYLQCSLGKQTFGTRDRCVSRSLHPEWRERFEFDTVLPGPAVLRLQVKHRSSFSKDKDIGVTEIDLERRYFSDQWRRRKLCPIETRALNAKGLKQLAKSFGNTGHGSVKLWVDIYQQHSRVSIPPPVDISRPPSEHFQLRLIIWNAEGMPLQGSNKVLKCHNMFFSAHMRTTEGGNVHEVKKETDTHWRAQKGRGEFNHRMIFDFEVDARLPVKKPCLLTLKCWDKEPLRLTNKLIGYKEINLCDILKAALQERLAFIRRAQMIDEHVEVGNVQEMQNLLSRLKEQDAAAQEERDDQDEAAKIRRSELNSRNGAQGHEDDEETEEATIAADSSNCDEMCGGCCSVRTQNLASAIGQLNEDQNDVAVLHATHEYRKNYMRCFHLNVIGDTQLDSQPGTDIPMVWASIELLHKSLADERKAGDARSDPNEHPILEEPVREKIGIRNLTGSLSVLVGAKHVKVAKVLIGVMLLVVIAMEIIPQVTSAFVLQALRKGLPLPCGAGFEKAANVFNDACGTQVYDSWLTSEDVTDPWKPKLDEDVLECLGPENCPGLKCVEEPYNWEKCDPPELQECVQKAKQQRNPSEKCYDPKHYKPELHDCIKWYPKLIADHPKEKDRIDEALTNLCRASKKPIAERTELKASVAPQNRFHLYNITDTKYRYAVDAVRRHTYNHGPAGTYKSIEDPELLTRVERLVAEKCRYGGAYYQLTHYGASADTSDSVACDQLRDHGILKDYAQQLRQNGLDGWFWKMVSFGQLPPYGFLTTPLLFPWEVDSCASTPCPRQCIAIEGDPSQIQCPATVAFWPLRLTGKFVAKVVVPLLALRLILYLIGSTVSRVRCCPRACKDTVRQAKIVWRWLWFRVMRSARKFRKAGSCAQCFCYCVVVLSLYFFAQ